MRPDANEHVKLFLLLLVIAAICAVTTMSCGSGGGGSDGGLCSQCGDTDGPCMNGEIAIPSGDRTPTLTCAAPPCAVFLVCARKLDSAQRRCFPAAKEDQLNSLDLAFECDGARPNPQTATPMPKTVTPTPGTVTPTPSTPTPAVTATF